MKLNGVADRRRPRPTGSSTNNFLSDGGDGFPAFTNGTNKYFGGLDIDAFADYLTAHSPYVARHRSTGSRSSREVPLTV